MDTVARPTKADLRSAILAARRALPADTRRTESECLCRHLSTLARAGQTVCAYVPVGGEPGSAAMLDLLVALGTRVLLPIARHDAAGTPEPLQWAPYRAGGLVPAPFGLREPAPPWLPAQAVGSAAVVLVPALAVDRTGARLGRGAGFYDRTLTLAARDAILVAVVRDEELLPELPHEPHDVRMTHALTPSGVHTIRE